MKLILDAQKFVDAIKYMQDRESFVKEYGEPEQFPYGIQVSLPNEKTITQNASFWQDMTTIATLLYTDKETVYAMLLRAEQFQDIWMEKSTYGKDKKPTWRFRTLSGLSKTEMSDFFPRYREYLQEVVNREYGEWIQINWARKETDGRIA